MAFCFLSETWGKVPSAHISKEFDSIIVGKGYVSATTSPPVDNQDMSSFQITCF